MNGITTGTGPIPCFTTLVSLRPGHRVIVPHGHPPYPVPPLPLVAQERTP